MVTAQRFITRVDDWRGNIVKVKWAAGAGTARPVNLLPVKRHLRRLNLYLFCLDLRSFGKSQR